MEIHCNIRKIQLESFFLEKSLDKGTGLHRHYIVHRYRFVHCTHIQQVYILMGISILQRNTETRLSEAPLDDVFLYVADKI